MWSFFFGDRNDATQAKKSAAVSPSSPGDRRSNAGSKAGSPASSRTLEKELAAAAHQPLPNQKVNRTVGQGGRRPQMARPKPKENSFDVLAEKYAEPPSPKVVITQDDVEAMQQATSPKPIETATRPESPERQKTPAATSPAKVVVTTSPAKTSATSSVQNPPEKSASMELGEIKKRHAGVTFSQMEDMERLQTQARQQPHRQVKEQPRAKVPFTRAARKNARVAAPSNSSESTIIPSGSLVETNAAAATTDTFPAKSSVVVDPSLAKISTTRTTPVLPLPSRTAEESTPNILPLPSRTIGKGVANILPMPSRVKTPPKPLLPQPSRTSPTSPSLPEITSDMEMTARAISSISSAISQADLSRLGHQVVSYITQYNNEQAIVFFSGGPRG